MDDGVIIAIIGLIGSSFSGFMVYIGNRLSKIEKKLDEHNHYAERFGEVKVDITSMKKDIEYLRKAKE